MPPNALITENEAREILKYILSVGQESVRQTGAQWSLPIGKSWPDADQNGARRRNRSLPPKLLIQASYKDLGDDGVPSLSQRAVRMLQAPQLDAARAHVMDKVEAQRFGVVVRSGGSLIYKGLDMTQVDSLKSVSLFARMSYTGGRVEVRLGGAQGA